MMSDIFPCLFLLQGVAESGTTDYQAAHTLILAHARAYRLYERKYKRYQGGKFEQVFVFMPSDQMIGDMLLWISPNVCIFKPFLLLLILTRYIGRVLYA